MFRLVSIASGRAGGFTIVRDIPSRALEYKRSVGNKTLRLATAYRAGFVLIVEVLLPLLENLLTLLTAVFVYRHGTSSFISDKFNI